MDTSLKSINRDSSSVMENKKYEVKQERILKGKNIQVIG